MNTYSVSYGCTNCGWQGTVSVNKGTEVLHKIMCPTCECFTAEREWTKQPTIHVLPKSYDLGPKLGVSPIKPWEDRWLGGRGVS